MSFDYLFDGVNKKRDANRFAPQQAPLHAPCPRCYSDCSPPLRALPKASRVAFLCKCGERFTSRKGLARQHTQWLLTRGRANVQASLSRDGE